MEERRSWLPTRTELRRALGREQLRVGARLRALRKRHGLTQEAVAAKLKVSKGQLGRVERGDDNVRLATLVALALLYRVEVWALFQPDGADLHQANCRPERPDGEPGDTDS